MDVAHSEVEKREQHDDSFLLIPSDVEHNGEVVDIGRSKNLFQFESYQRPRVGVVTLACIEHARNTVDIAKVELVVFILGTAAGENHAIFGECFGKFGVVVAVFHTSVATAHHKEFADGTTLDSFHDFIGQSKYLGVGKTTYNLTVLDFRRCLTLLGHLDNLGEVLVAVSIGQDVLPTRITGGIGSENTILIIGVGQWRYNAVGSKYYRAIERTEFFFLTPPCVAIITHEVLIFLEYWIVVAWEHFAMGVDINARPFSLLEELFEVAQVMPRDENTRTVAHSDIDARDFGITIRSGVGLVEQRHSRNAIFAHAKHERIERIGRGIGVGDVVKSFAHKCDKAVVAMSQAGSVFIIGCYSFEAEHYDFLHRTDILIGYAQNGLTESLSIIVLATASPCNFSPVGKFHAVLFSQADELLLEEKACIDLCHDTFIIEIGTADSGKKRVDDEIAHSLLSGYASSAEQMINRAHAASNGNEEVHISRGLWEFTTHAAKRTACTFHGFLTLITKHLRFHTSE